LLAGVAKYRGKMKAEPTGSQRSEWVALLLFFAFGFAALLLTSLYNPDNHKQDSFLPLLSVASGLLSILSLGRHIGLRFARKRRKCASLRKKAQEIISGLD
jgi:hypothetical protein